MHRLANNENGGLLTFGVAGALWSSSAALVSIVGALNRAYDIDEGRPWWKVRLVAMGLTLATAMIVLLALSLVLAGPALARGSERRPGGAFHLSGRGSFCSGPWYLFSSQPVSGSSITSDRMPIRTGRGPITRLASPRPISGCWSRWLFKVYSGTTSPDYEGSYGTVAEGSSCSLVLRHGVPRFSLAQS